MSRENWTIDRLIVGMLFGYSLFSTLSVWAANLFVDAALLLAVIRCWKSRDGLSFDKGLAVSVAAMVGAAILAGIFALDSRKSIQPVWFILYHTAPMFLALAYIKTKRQILALSGGLAVSLAASSLYAIYQATQGMNRPPGFTGDWFILAGQLSILIPYFFVLAITSPDLWPPARNLLGATVAVALGALVVNATRGAWIAVVGSVIVFLACWTRDIKKLLVWAIGFMLILMLVAGTLHLISGANNSRFVARGLNTAGERFRIWQSSLNMIADYPLLGVGPGNYAQQYEQRYILPSAQERKSQPHAHNNVLSVSSEMGLVGLVAFIGLFYYIIRHFWISFRHSVGANRTRITAALLITLSFQLHGLSDYTFLGFPTVIQTYWFLIGMLWKEI